VVLSENPTNVSAVRLQAGFMENHAERLALAESLVKAHPDSGPAWGLLARAHGVAGSPVAVQEQALVRAVELSPDDAGAHNNLAWLYVQTNVPQKGYEPALRAVKRAPYSPSYVDTYAAVLFGMGQCDKSISTQRRAIELLEEKVPAEVRQVLQGRLTKYETACREREAAGAPAPEQSKPAQ
jgi:Tfp pilus assembly protein PilF